MSYPIVLACDNAYGMPLATALRSIIDANRDWWPIEFHILAFSISDATQQKVLRSLPEGSASIRWIPVNLDRFNRFSTLDHVSKITYARLLIPTIFSEAVAKVLYLDSDLLVLGDLTKLCETDIEDVALGAVLDGLDAQIKGGKPNLGKIPKVDRYFNAGVLLINLSKWRKERITEKALTYLEENPLSPFSDQDALNVVCDRNWKELDSHWNFIDYYEQVKISSLSPEQRPGIVHFATPNKPWNASTRNANSSFYDSFRSRTLFARTQREICRDAALRNWSRVKRALKRYPAVRAIWNQIKLAGT